MTGSAVREPPPNLSESFAARGTPQEERELPVRDRVLGEVVVDDEGVHAVVPEVLAYGAARVRGYELQRRRGARCGGNDDRVVHRAVLLELLDYLRDRGLLLADGNVYAEYVLALLVNDGVYGDCGLACLAVAYYELPLPPSDGYHGVYGLYTGLERLLDGLPGYYAGGLYLDPPELIALDGALGVYGLAQGVYDPAHERLAYGYLDYPAGPLDRGAFFNCMVAAEDGGSDVVLFEVKDHAVDAARELEGLSCHGLLKAVYPRYTVAHRYDGAVFLYVNFLLKTLYLGLNELAYFLFLDHRLNHPFEYFFFHELKLGLQAAVEYGVLDLQYQSAQKSRVRAACEYHFLAGELTEPLSYVVYNGAVELRGSLDRCPYPSGELV